MSKDIIVSLAISLALTLVFEVFFFLVVRSNRGKLYKKDLLLVVLVNILTNPALVLIFRLTVLYTDANYVIHIIILLEIIAALTEGYIYKKHGDYFKRPYVFSIAANIFSFGSGLVLQYFQII